jgi:hypothetical protein
MGDSANFGRESGWLGGRMEEWKERKGGLVIAPNNVVQYDVPLENLLGVYETAKGISAKG